MSKQTNKNEATEQGSALQKIEDHSYSIELAIEEEKRLNFRKSLENFTKNLNRAPDANKVKEHDGYKYIPISTIEKDLARYFFGLVQYKIISYQQILNEFVVHARIEVWHPVIQQWISYDGIGCGMFQQKASTPISDFYIYKHKTAGKLTCPNAYAEAIKNAAKKIGKKFGSDINRVFEDQYKGLIKEETDEKPLN